MAQTSPGPVPLSNGSFEEGLKGWSLRNAPNATPGSEYQLAPEAMEGKQSAAITVGETSKDAMKTSAYVARRDLPVVPGYYRFRFAMSTDMTQGVAGAKIIVLGPDDKVLSVCEPGQGGVPSIATKTGWTRYEFIYKIPENAKTSVLQLQAVGLRGRVAFDDVSLERLTDEAGIAAMKQQNPQAPSLQEVGAQKLEAPCRNINPRYSALYRDPVTGRTFLALNSCTPGQGAALLVDYQENKSWLIPLPVGAGGWDMLQIAPDKMVFESLSPLYVVPVDIREKKVIESGIAQVKGNDYAWRFAQGSDGAVYMGSYPTAHLYRYWPNNSKVEDLGLQGPEGNLYNRHVGATSDGWVLSSMGLSKGGVSAYNIASKEQIWLETGDASPTLASVAGKVYATFGGSLKQFNGATRSFKEAELPPLPGGVKWTVMLQSSTADRLVVRADDNKYYVIEKGQAPRAVWDLELRGGAVAGVDENGQVVGFRGQDYFVAKPLAKSIDPKPITTEALPVGIHFLRADPKGGVTGGPGFGQTLFRYDPARKLLQNTPQVLDSGGEVYDGRWVGGKFYFIAYAGGDLAVWDPTKPWDQWNNKNPKKLHSYKGVADGELIRPIGGLVVGPKGRLYGGWSAAYKKEGGGLTEYDIKTKKARSWKNDIVAEKMSIGAIAADKRYVYGVTSNHFSGIRPPAKPLDFFVFDPQTQKVVFKQRIEGTTGNPAVIHVPETDHIWLAVPAGLQRFDSKKMQFVQTLPWPKEVGAPGNFQARDSAGSAAWLATGKTVVRIDDGDTPTVRALFTAENPVGAMTAGTDGKLYFSQELNIWSLPLETK